jgi:hypothetical protein
MFGKILLAGIVLASCSVARADELVYQGDWKTTNRELDGTVTCVITRVAAEKWKGRFYGTWQGIEFDYKVDFVGPPNRLHGTAVIDDATYEWKGWLTDKNFKANFGGDRYQGSFDLTRKKIPSRAAAVSRGR